MARVAVDLPLQHRLHVGDLDGVRKLDDALHRQKAAVGGVLGAFLGVGAVEQHISVLFQPDDVCVEPGDLGKGGVAAGRDPHLDVKNKVFVRRVDVDDALLFIGGDLFRPVPA